MDKVIDKVMDHAPSNVLHKVMDSHFTLPIHLPIHLFIHPYKAMDMAMDKTSAPNRSHIPMPITQDRLIALAEAGDNFFQLLKGLKNVEKSLYNPILLSNAQSVLEHTEDKYAQKLIEKLLEYFNQIHNIFLELEINEEDVKTIITEKTHFKQNKKRNDYNRNYKKYKTGIGNEGKISIKKFFEEDTRTQEEIDLEWEMFNKLKAENKAKAENKDIAERSEQGTKLSSRQKSEIVAEGDEKDKEKKETNNPSGETSSSERSEQSSEQNSELKITQKVLDKLTNINPEIKRHLPKLEELYKLPDLNQDLI